MGTLSINPIRRALVPVDSRAAQAVIAPNYDEFQSDREIWDILQHQPESILRITMAHCAVDSPSQFIEEGSPAALLRAKANLDKLRKSPLVKELEQCLFIYQIEDVRRPGVRQIGLGGSAKTSEIRTEKNPEGTIIRNEGIRESKAKGRADLIRETKTYTEIVNNTVEDPDGKFGSTLEKFADDLPPDFVVHDERGNKHSMWFISEPASIAVLQAALADRKFAYVADGNHRSHAAAMLGKPEFLAVFFTTERMGIYPYNRLVNTEKLAQPELLERLNRCFTVKALPPGKPYVPPSIHHLGIYTEGAWLELQVKTELYTGRSTAEQIDAALVQTHILDGIFGIADARDERITYVGGNKDAAYLCGQVDSGEFNYAIQLAPVEMSQFVGVCRENAFMPPKSTWFEPKVRSGLVMSLLE